MVVLAALLLVLEAGCSSSSIPAHELDAVVEYDGVTTRGVLSFPERDPEGAHSDGDSSCGWSSGDCGSDSPTHARISGAGTPITSAVYTTLHTGENVTYDIGIARTPADEAAYREDEKARGYIPGGQGGITCRVYDSELGKPQDCYYARSTVRITLTRR